MPHDCAVPSHVTGLYIFAVVNLIGLFHVSLVSGDVEVLKTGSNDTITSLRDAEASFGVDIPKNGVVGYLIYVSPLNISDSCFHYAPAPPDGNISDNLVWIALIQRNGCKFDHMVYNAQKLGYKAVMVYNQRPNEDLVPMGGDKYAHNVAIPSVFIGWTDGDLLRKRFLYDDSGTYFIKINKNPNYYKPYMLWPFVVVVGVCFVLMLLFMVIKWIRDIRKRKKSRLSTKHLKKIPTKKFKKGDEYDVCAVCLDDFEEGDKLRILPCAHAYHCKCIDPWLTKRKKTCPVCKRKVIPGNNPDSESDSDWDDEEQGSNERTPLLSGNNNDVMTTPRRSTFDNSGLPVSTSSQVTQINVTSPESSESDPEAEDEPRYGATGGIDSSANQIQDSKVDMETNVTGENRGYCDSDEEETDVNEEGDPDNLQVVVNGNVKQNVEKKNHVV